MAKKIGKVEKFGFSQYGFFDFTLPGTAIFVTRKTKKAAKKERQRRLQRK
tara:strand:- start:563 stop:712 length:150 start_codon:yes stop_codon:yes gene_type:complete